MTGPDRPPNPPQRTSPAASLATTVVFAAFIAVLGLFPGIPVAGGVPIVLQNMGVVLAGTVLGPRRGVAAVLLWLALAAIGLPLLTGGRGGLAVFVGPTGGYLIGYVLAVLVAGFVVTRSARPTFPLILLASVAGMFTSYVTGIPWVGVYTGDMTTALVSSLVFVPGDLAKAVLVAIVTAAVHRALPGRLPSR